MSAWVKGLSETDMESRQHMSVFVVFTKGMTNIYIQPADKSWTVTKVVAVLAALFTAGYMLPWAVAAVRDVPHWLVFWINLLLGWTIVGWIIALIMAFRAQRVTVVARDIGE